VDQKSDELSSFDIIEFRYSSDIECGM